MKLREAGAQKFGFNSTDAVFSDGQVRSGNFSVARGQAASAGELVAEATIEFGELGRQLKSKGFRGRFRVVIKWTTRRRKAEKVDGSALSRAPLGQNYRAPHDHRSRRPVQVRNRHVAAIEGGVPLMVEAREIIAAFQAMIRKKSLTDLQLWLGRARSGLIAAFRQWCRQDRAAFSAAILLLGLSGRDVSDRLQKPPIVEPVYPALRTRRPQKSAMVRAGK